MSRQRETKESTSEGLLHYMRTLQNTTRSGLTLRGKRKSQVPHVVVQVGMRFTFARFAFTKAELYQGVNGTCW